MFTPNVDLHRGLLVELVQDHVRLGVALELDDEPHAALVGVVLDVRDAGELLVGDEVGDLLDDAAVAALLDLKGSSVTTIASLPRPMSWIAAFARTRHAPATGLVRVADALPAEDDAAGREVRAR